MKSSVFGRMKRKARSGPLNLFVMNSRIVALAVSSALFTGCGGAASSTAQSTDTGSAPAAQSESEPEPIEIPQSDSVVSEKTPEEIAEAKRVTEETAAIAVFGEGGGRAALALKELAPQLDLERGYVVAQGICETYVGTTLDPELITATVVAALAKGGVSHEVGGEMVLEAVGNLCPEHDSVTPELVAKVVGSE